MSSNRFLVASALLAVWERPWSQNAIRYCVHALTLAHDRGLDVLEARRTRYTSAQAIIAYSERPASERAHRAAREALATAARLAGMDSEEWLDLD